MLVLILVVNRPVHLSLLSTTFQPASAAAENQPTEQIISYQA
jgi:hypothetical protein